MDTVFNIITALFALVIALVASGIAIRVFDKYLFPTVDFADHLSGGNGAVGKVVAAIIVMTFFTAAWVMAAPPDYNRYDAQFRKWGKWEFGRTVDWRHFKAQGLTESLLNPGLCSHVGACGVMQFMPATAVAMGVTNRFDAKQSIRGGIKYDKRLWDQFTAPRPKLDRLAFTFMAYNAGLGNVLIWQKQAVAAGVNPNLFETLKPWVWKEPRGYVERSRRWYARLKRNKRWTG
ncbi:MAG: transglycosylase SLT domain-containing protein [Candidatus Glassbacteria bacterium]|nr:transglycosylase SLT domain-containing protein [Candidatus Glassbacteria bacterium]